RVVRHEAIEQVQVRAIEHFDMRSAAGAGGGDDVGYAVAVDVGIGDADAATEDRVVGHEVGDESAGDGLLNADVRPAAFTRSDSPLLHTHFRSERVTENVVGDAGALIDTVGLVERPMDAEVNAALAVFFDRLAQRVEVPRHDRTHVAV